MKKTLAFALFLCSFSIFAQTEKGTFRISGETGLNFSTAKTSYPDFASEEGPTVTTFNLTPGAGYFVIDNLAIGLDFSYTSTTMKQKDFGANSKYTTNQFSIVPNVTYYFSKEKVKPYLTGGLGYSTITTKSSTSQSIFSSNENSKSGGLLFAVGGGVAYFISKSFSLDLGLGYSQANFKTEGFKSNSKAFVANVGFSFFLK